MIIIPGKVYQSADNARHSSFFLIQFGRLPMACMVDFAVLFLELFLILVSYVSVLLHDLFYTPVWAQCRLVNKINHACHLAACQI